jgi:hypothetical protein
MISVDIENAKNMIDQYAAALFNGEVDKVDPINLQAKPGVGKSAIIAQIAEKYNAKMIDLRLSSQDPTTLTGMPYVTNEEMRHSTPEWFPENDDENVIIFFDEITNAPVSTQQAAYRLILDRTIDNGKMFPKKTLIISAGNNRNDGGGSKDLLAPLANRFGLHMQVNPDHAAFTNYAVSKGFNKEIIGFLNFSPDFIHKMPENKADLSFPSPRSWEAVNNHMNIIGKSNTDMLSQVVAGTIGEAAASKFMSYFKYKSKLPDFDKIANGEQEYTVDTNDIGLLFSLTTSVAFVSARLIDDNDKTENIKKIVGQLPKENQVFFFKLMYNAMQAEGVPASKIPRSPWREYMNLISSAMKEF